MLSLHSITDLKDKSYFVPLLSKRLQNWIDSPIENVIFFGSCADLPFAPLFRFFSVNAQPHCFRVELNDIVEKAREWCSFPRLKAPENLPLPLRGSDGPVVVIARGNM